ncbi:hypothetical protein ANO11243_038760 [Dothideomycetidae sp. 11243]|nr:hypothetical protein ANO11243_038760 [fungal sp. No.11243]
MQLIKSAQPELRIEKRNGEAQGVQEVAGNRSASPVATNGGGADKEDSGG